MPSFFFIIPLFYQIIYVTIYDLKEENKMRITRLRNTQRLFNKVDKRYYLVTNAAIGEVSAIDENGMIIPDEPVLTVTE